MKRTILNIARFAAFFAAFYFVVMLVIATTTAFTFDIEKIFFKTSHFYSYNDQRIKDLNHWLEGDTNKERSGLILGSSSICLNINPYVLTEKTGVDFFVAGNDGQPLSNSLIMFEYCLGSGKKIDYLLLGVDHLVWGLKSNGASLDWIVKDTNPYQWHLLKMVADTRSGSIAVVYSYLLIKHLWPFSKYYNPEPPSYSCYVGNGYKCSKLERQKLQFEPSVPNRTITDNNYKAFNKITQLCKENNITLITIKPKLINYNGKNDTLDRKGIPIINAMNAPVDTSLFYDNYHMYCEGGTVYSEWIAGQINKIIQHSNP